MGIRLGQAGEFVYFWATALKRLISTEANSLIQLTIVLSIILSSLFISKISRAQRGRNFEKTESFFGTSLLISRLINLKDSFALRCS